MSMDLVMNSRAEITHALETDPPRERPTLDEDQSQTT